MEPQTIKLREMRVGGVHERTTRAAETAGEVTVPRLWELYRSSDVCGNRAGDPKNPQAVYVLYSEYELDAEGRADTYTILIGHEMTGQGIPPGEHCKMIRVPASKYLVFTSRRGPLRAVVREVWDAVDAYFRSSAYKRAYTGDFELYDGRANDPANAVVDIYISVKEN